MSDLIDRKQAILAVCSVCSAVRPEYRGEKCIHFADGCEEIERLNELPSAQPEPVRHGKWLDSETFKRPWFRHHVFECSVCRNTLDMDGVNAGRGDANYCPNCGARMDAGGPIYPFDAEMSKLNEDDDQIEKYKDWIVRYYASHDDIPEGKYDGHIVRELIRCKDCDNYKHWECPVEQAGYRPMGDMYCSWAERKTGPSDRPITCDYCKHWHGLKRDGKYWCSKHSAYMETGCDEAERKEE